MSFEDPIIIVGCPRSGTSLTAGIIDACGAFGGDIGEGDERNAKGFFENNELTPMFDQMLREMQLVAAIIKLSKADSSDFVLDCGSVRRGVERALRAQGYTDGPWYFKYPNALNNMTAMSSIFPNARWVITRRAEKDIRASTPSDLFRFASSSQSAVTHFLDRLESVREFAPNAIEVWPFQMLAQGVDQFKPLIEQLGLTWDDEAVRAFADPALVHHDSQQLFEVSQR